MSIEERQCLFSLAQEVLNSESTPEIATHGMSLAVFVNECLTKEEEES